MILFLSYTVLSLFPKELIARFNDDTDQANFELGTFFGSRSQDIINCLDSHAKQTIYSIIMVEYARCTQLPSEAVVKAFEGVNMFPSAITARDIEIAKVLKAIQENSNDET